MKYTFLILLSTGSFLTAATVDTNSSNFAFGFDVDGNAYTSVTNGDAVYTADGTFCGNWTITNETYFTDDTSIGFGNNPEGNGTTRTTNTAAYRDNVTGTFAAGGASRVLKLPSFNAAADSGDYVIVTSQSLNMTMTDAFADVRFRGRGETDSTLEYSFTLDNYNYVNASGNLGATNIDQTPTLNNTTAGSFTIDNYTGYVDPGGDGWSVISGGTDTFTGNFEISVSGGSVSFFDGTNIYLGFTKNGDFTIDEPTDYTATGNGNIPQVQSRSDVSGSGDYTLNYQRYSFSGDLNHIPEPSSTLLIALSGIVVLNQRKRSV